MSENNANINEPRNETPKSKGQEWPKDFQQLRIAESRFSETRYKINNRIIKFPNSKPRKCEDEEEKSDQQNTPTDQAAQL